MVFFGHFWTTPGHHSNPWMFFTDCDDAFPQHSTAINIILLTFKINVMYSYSTILCIALNYIKQVYTALFVVFLIHAE